jgi:P27 family predicted phage terminase small subunit
MRGRKPKPEPLDKPTPAGEVPSAPPHLDREAKAEWKRVSAELAGCGLLSLVDRAALAAYCQIYSRWITAEKALAEEGLVIESAKGNPMANPHCQIAARALQQMKSYLVEFGMTPAARIRIAEPVNDDFLPGPEE